MTIRVNQPIGLETKLSEAERCALVGYGYLFRGLGAILPGFHTEYWESYARISFRTAHHWFELGEAHRTPQERAHY